MGTALTLLIVLVYAYVGYKLNKNFILWGLLGFGILVGPPLIVGLTMNLIPFDWGLELWPLIILGSFLFSIIFIGWTAYKNNIKFKRDPGQP